MCHRDNADTWRRSFGKIGPELFDEYRHARQANRRSPEKLTEVKQELAERFKSSMGPEGLSLLRELCDVEDCLRAMPEAQH